MATKSAKALRKLSRLRETKAARLAEEWPGFHPSVLTYIRPGAKYVSASLKEYYIRQDGMYYSIHKYRGASVSPRLRGSFTTFREAEEKLINWLKATDKFGKKARYPGSPNGPRSD
jgi:hypothetical protein